MESKEYKFVGDGLETQEKRLACIRFNEYVKNYNISSYSDLQLLEELVYRETLQSRTKKNIEDKRKKAEEKNEDVNIPTYLVDSLDTSTETIIILKERLGILRDIKDADEGFNYIQKLKDKMKIWAKENQDRTFACPHCSKMILLYMKPDAWETMKHPFFESKVLGNKKLVELYKQGKLTKQEVADVLGCSDKYIDWLINKWNLNETKNT